MKRFHALTAASLLTYAAFIPRAEAKTISFYETMACSAPASFGNRIAGASEWKEQIANTSGGPIAYYRFGKGSPIVLVTGFRATLAEWNASFLSELAKHHEIIVFDNRGVGKSMPDDTSFTVGDMAHDTANLIDELHLENVTVVGWSMGGAIVQQLAIDAPPAVRRIVLMNTTAPGSTGTTVPAPAMATLSGKSGADLEAIMATLFPPSAVKPAVNCFEKDMFRPAGYDEPKIPDAVTNGQTALLASWANDDAAARALHQVRIPVLVLEGADDAVLAPHNGYALEKLLPVAHVITVRHAGHAMMYQYPHSIAGLINTFSALTLTH